MEARLANSSPDASHFRSTQTPAIYYVSQKQRLGFAVGQQVSLEQACLQHLYKFRIEIHLIQQFIRLSLLAFA